MDIQKFIEDNIDLIDDENFNELYDRCTTNEEQSSLTETLYACGIDPLVHMTEIPGWFTYRSALTSMTIPDCITSIGTYAFSGCINLTSIVIPDSVTSIGWSAFFGWKSLASITIPDSVTSIGDAAFRDCDNLKSVTIGSGVTSIGSEVFRDCDGLTSITIPSSITSIGEAAFWRCVFLTSITISDSVTSIGDHVFAYCHKLTSINYLGTKAQWRAIAKHQQWKRGSAIKQINCSDGIINLR